jgi:hypothetical protein
MQCYQFCMLVNKRSAVYKVVRNEVLEKECTPYALS